jgi:VWFA-related protein
MRMKHALIAITIYLAGAAVAFGQSVPPPPPPPVAQTNPNAPALKVTSRVVQVNVIVRDKNGRPVIGLTKKDFTILDNGQAQTISSMLEQSNKVTTTMVSASAKNTFSNRVEEQYGAAPTVSVILIDKLNGAHTGFAMTQVAKYLRQMQPQDSAALYYLSDKLYMLHDFTNDSAALLRSLDFAPKLQQDTGDATTAMDFAPVDLNAGKGDTGGAARAISRALELSITNRVHNTKDALEAIAKHLAGIPGRKNLIWISDSFPFLIYTEVGIVMFEPQIIDESRALSDANVAVYAIDARGLTVGHPDPQTVNTMVALADRTGGRSYRNTNDLSAAIRRATEDARVTYVLTYYPNHNQWDGRYREISVKVNHPGVDVRARRGYFALPDAVVPAKSAEEIMVDAAKNPLESEALGIDVHADAIAVSGARQIKTQVKFDPAQLLLAKNADHWTDTVDVKWVQLAADGHVLASTSQTLNLNIPVADYESVSRKGVSFLGSVKLVNDATDVRLVARDAGNGSVGTVNISLVKLFGPTTSTVPVTK